LKKVNKVIIPVAGLGTRMIPATKSIPKEMLPIFDKPLIQIIVEEAIQAGFKNIIFVTHKNKSSIIDHFKKNLELEISLKKKKSKFLLKELNKLSKFNSYISTVEQEEIKGLGHAILCAKDLILDENFAVMLPDMIISYGRKKNFLEMKKNFEEYGNSSILLSKVEKSEVQNYGIAKFKKGIKTDNFFQLEEIVEKPLPNKSTSNLAAVGRYIFDNELLRFLSIEKPDSSGEIQLSGAISSFMKTKKKINGLILDGEFHDCGSKSGYIIANLAFSMKDKSVKKEVLKYLNK